MEEKYFIYAYEDSYSGLHGIYDCRFVECTYEQAEEWGHEMSYDVIESYSYLLDEICDEDATEEEREEAIQADIAYEIWKVRDDAPSFEELEAMSLDPESYIKEYCQPCQD